MKKFILENSNWQKTKKILALPGLVVATTNHRNHQALTKHLRFVEANA